MLKKRPIDADDRTIRADVGSSHSAASLHPKGWRLILSDLGVDQARLLRRAGLPGDLLARERQKMATADYYRLWEAFEIETIGSALPLPILIAQAISVEWFDPATFAALCSSDLNLALSRLTQFKSLCSPVILDVTTTSASTTVTLKWLDKTLIPPPVLVAAELVFFVQLARLATRSPIRPIDIRFPNALASSADYANYLGVMPTHGATHSVTFSAADARSQFLTANESIWSLFEPNLRTRLHEIDSAATTADRVRSALVELLPIGNSSMHAVARKLGVSTRTLQRRLRIEGGHFQQTLSQVRMDLALHYLRKTSMSSAEIALLLGFDDPNSFVRAFHSWTGTTPQRRRAEKQQDPNDVVATTDRCRG